MIARTCDACGEVLKGDTCVQLTVRLIRTNQADDQDALAEQVGEYCPDCQAEGLALADLRSGFANLPPLPALRPPPPATCEVCVERGLLPSVAVACHAHSVRYLQERQAPLRADVRSAIVALRSSPACDNPGEVADLLEELLGEALALTSAPTLTEAVRPAGSAAYQPPASRGAILDLRGRS